MLVLTRRQGEWIVLRDGDTEVRFQVAGIGRDRVKLAIDAPDDVRIWRGELLEQTDGERRSS